jgi:hypothetical protein
VRGGPTSALTGVGVERVSGMRRAGEKRDGARAGGGARPVREAGEAFSAGARETHWLIRPLDPADSERDRVAPAWVPSDHCFSGCVSRGIGMQKIKSVVRCTKLRVGIQENKGVRMQ